MERGREGGTLTIHTYGRINAQFWVGAHGFPSLCLCCFPHSPHVSPKRNIVSGPAPHPRSTELCSALTSGSFHTCLISIPSSGKEKVRRPYNFIVVLVTTVEGEWAPRFELSGAVCVRCHWCLHR